MWGRSEYKLSITLNKRKYTHVLIDQHYRLKHKELSDEIILELVKAINFEILHVEERRGEFSYYIVVPVFFSARPYRLILVVCSGEDYLGVVNAFRVGRS